MLSPWKNVDLRIAAALGLTLCGVNTFANTEIILSQGGHTPYMFVHKDEQGGSKRDAGIYTADEKGEWYQIVKGNLLRGDTVTGVLTQLNISKKTNLFESVAVVDGMIKVFDRTAKLDDANSVITLGEGNHEFVDAMTGLTVQIDKLTRIQDIQVLQLEATPLGQGLLVSVKQDANHGDGITFGMVVKTHAAKSGTPLELAYPPVVIDYRYLDLTQLTMIDRKDGHTAYSGSLLRSLSRKKPSDPPVVAAWRITLGNFIAGVYKHVLPRAANTIPYVDLNDGRVHLQQVPAASIASQVPMIQAYNPVTGANGVIWGTQLQARYNVRGEVTLDDHGNFRVYSSSIVHTGVALTYLDRELHLLIHEASQPNNVLTLNLEPAADTLPESVAMHTQRFKANSTAPNELYVFISRKYASGDARTELYVVSQLGTTLHLTKHLQINKLFVPEDEMAARSRINPESEILYDNKTPPQESVLAYHQVASDSIPFVNLTKTTDDTHKLSYLEALERTDVNRSLSYDIYDEEGISVNQRLTGLYLREGKRVIEQLSGEVLRTEGQSKESIELISKDLNLPSPMSGKGHLSVIALDRGFQGGKNAVTAAVILTYDGGGTTSGFQPILTDVALPLPYEQLVGTHVVTHSKHKDQLTILFLFKDAKAKTGVVSKSLIRAVNVEIEFNPKATPPTAKFVQGGKDFEILADEEITVGELRSRSTPHDSEGNPLWVMTPDLEKKNVGFKLINLKDAKELAPNASRTKKKIVFDSEKGDEEGGFSHLGSWNAWFEGTVRDRVGNVIIPERSEKVKEADIEKSLAEEKLLFPGLDETLERLADPAHSAQHEIFIVADPQKGDPNGDKVIFERQMLTALFRTTKQKKWNKDNIDLFIFDFGKATQDEIHDNFAGMKRVKKDKRAVLFADGASLYNAGRPSSGSAEKEPFVLKDLESTEGEGNDDKGLPPHALYMLGTEGEFLDLPEFKERKAEDWKNQVSMALVFTQTEWRNILSQIEPEQRAGLLKRFNVNMSYANGPWKVWGPNLPKRMSPEVKLMQKQPVSKLQQDIFPDLARVIEKTADPNEKPVHRVLLVPPDLRSLIRRIVFSRWANSSKESGADKGWNYRNSELNLYEYNLNNMQLLGIAAYQEVITQNLEALRGSAASGKRAALVADLSEIANSGRPNSNGTSPYVIKDHAEKLDIGENLEEVADGVELTGTGEEQLDDSGDEARNPHLLWLLANEGKRIATQQFEATKIPQNKISMLLIGTEDEWQRIQKEASFESRFGLFKDSQFEVIKLDPPSIEARMALVSSILDSSSVKNLGLEYVPDKVGPGNSRDRMISYLINGSDRYAKRYGVESTTAFIKTLSELSRAIVHDRVLRASDRKIVDKSFLERLFSRVFGIPLNLNILPPDDPLVRLSNKKQMAFDLQNAGLNGPLEIKYQLIRTLLDQTKTGEVGRAIPSSVILFGKTSTGKTYLFKKLVEVLGLQLYDFNRPYDENAQALIIDAKKLVKTPENQGEHEGEGMSVRKAIAHINNFLSLPNGYRGYILIDDIHAVSNPESFQELWTYLRSLQEAPNGVFSTTLTLEGNDPDTVAEVPVRNLNLFMTLNPTEDQDLIRKYRGYASDKGMIIASLAHYKVQIEESALQRWGTIMNLNEFPTEAKAPALLDNLRGATQNEFTLQNRLSLVSPISVNRLIEKTSDANAREFLSSATNEFLRLPDNQGHNGKAPFYMIGPKPLLLDSDWIPNTSPEGDPGKIFERDSTGRAERMIEATIRNDAVAIPVDERHYDGQLRFLSLLIDTFRTYLYETLIRAVTQEPAFVDDDNVRRYLLASFLHAITSNLQANPEIPIKALSLDPMEFQAMSIGQKSEFKRAVETLQPFPIRMFPVRFADELNRGDSLGSMLDHSKRNEREKSRADILAENTQEASKIERELMSIIFRVDALDTLPDTDEWLKKLSERNPDQELHKIGVKLVDLYKDYARQIDQPGLAETTQPEKFETMTNYDSIRLFLMSIDKAIVKLPWARMMRFMMRNVQRATDMEIGQLAGVQHYFFVSKISALKPLTKDAIMQVAASSEVYNSPEWSKENKQRIVERFRSNCENFLVQE